MSRSVVRSAKTGEANKGLKSTINEREFSWRTSLLLAMRVRPTDFDSLFQKNSSEDREQQIPHSALDNSKTRPSVAAECGMTVHKEVAVIATLSLARSTFSGVIFQQLC